MRWLLFLLITPVCFALRADINGDCRVDMADLAILASEWMQEDENCMSRYYLTIDGASGYLTVPDNAAVRLGTSDFTISLWARWSHFPATGEAPPILIKSGVHGFEWQFYLDIAANSIAMAIEYSTIEGALPAGGLKPNTWYHLAVSVARATQGSGSVFYVNNVALALNGSIYEESHDNDASMVINTSVAGEQIFDIDDIRIYKKALSAAEIETIYNGGIGKVYDVADAGAGLAFDLDEGTGNPVSTGSATLTGTITGGVTWNLGQPHPKIGAVSMARRLLLWD